MNSPEVSRTPRLPSAFVATPQRAARRTQGSSKLRHTLNASGLKPAQSTTHADAPVIPLTTFDAVTQRTLALSFWVGLLCWKLADWYGLYKADDPESLWLFMKWVVLDGVFLFGLPAFRIPWLEWSSSAMTVFFLIHAFFDAVLMFRLSLPFSWVFAWFWKLVWDRELAISETSYRPDSVVDPSQLIQGRHVIKILPEGSAVLNPFNKFFCVGGETHQAFLPIHINQTTPTLIELLRRDFDNQSHDVLTIKANEVKKLIKEARDLHSRTKGAPRPTDELLLHYPVRKPGQYTLRKIMDQTDLEVRPRRSEIIVASCPTARVVSQHSIRCKGDLSDLSFEVEGTPPMKLKYRKLVNDNPTEASFQSIQPTEFVVPHSRQQQLATTQASSLDVSWASPQKVAVPINETVMALGYHSYFIDEVQDALGNKVTYFKRGHDETAPNTKHPEVSQKIAVYDRPAISVHTAACNAERPLKVAQGREVDLPHQILSAGRADYGSPSDYGFNEDHIIDYEFFPQSALDKVNADPLAVAQGTRRTFVKRTRQEQIIIKDPGLYVFKDIRTSHCQGEILEPSSCLLQNPPRPDVDISSTEITHKCANSPIGLTVTFDFEGTPPFTVKYTEEKSGSKKTFQRSQTFDSHRGQIAIRQAEAGHYKYRFTSVSDKFYDLEKIDKVLEQSVKPSASAFIDQDPSARVQNVCLGDSANFPIRLVGEAPWSLEYEVIQGRSRTKHTKTDITDPMYNLNVAEVAQGGEYTLALSSVTDNSKCKEFLKGETKFTVWGQRPTVGFGKVSNKHSVDILEGKTIQLPLRFIGQRPFVYSWVKEESGVVTNGHSGTEAHYLEVREPGTYGLFDIRDAYCAGEIDSKSSKFVVNFVKRPALSIAQHQTVKENGPKFVKNDICEGDEDSVDLALQGMPPFFVKYEENGKPEDGQKFIKTLELNAAGGLATIQLDTSKAGQFEYKFKGISDANYDANSKKVAPVVLEQLVLPRPSARFTYPGNTYSFCTTEGKPLTGSPDEIIPIKLSGTPPFSLDIDIRYSGSASPESISVDNIKTLSHELRLPQKYMRSGNSHLTIRRVRDGRGCHSKVNTAVAPSTVHISVHDPPAIIPLEPREDFCVGERLSFRLNGVPPFTIYYKFNDKNMKAVEKTTTFTRLNALPGDFVITEISDSSSKCRFPASIHKIIHDMPRVRVSEKEDRIHEGGESVVNFELSGTPPFELTYTRSEYSRKNKRGQVLETKTERTYDNVLSVKESEGGEYEPISVRDKWCLTSKAPAFGSRKSQKLLMN